MPNDDVTPWPYTTLPWQWPWQQPDSNLSLQLPEIVGVLPVPPVQTVWYISELPANDDTMTAGDAYLYACLLQEMGNDGRN